MTTLNSDVILHALATKPAPLLPELHEQEPTDLAPKRRGLKYAPIDRQQRTVVSLSQGQTMIRAAIAEYQADPMPEHMLLVAAPAGIGKTTIGVELAESVAALSGKVMYIGPRKEFFTDLMNLASHPAWWYAWQSRHDGAGIGLDATCRYPHQIKMWQERGYESRAFCLNPRICGGPYMRGTCRYYAQEQRTENIIFAQYEHIALGHLLLDRMSLIIGDELPIRAFLFPWHIPTHAILPPDMPDGPTSSLLERLRTLATIRSVPWRGTELLDALGGAAYVEWICRQYEFDETAKPVEPELRSVDDVDELPYFHLPWLIRLLRRESERTAAGQSSISRVAVDRSGLTLLLRRAPRQLPPHVIWLDATANSRLYETLFRRPVKVIQPDVALQGRVRQVWAGLNNKMGLAGDGTASPKIDHIQQQIARILSRGYRRPALISYKDLVQQLASSGDIPLEMTAHFGGSRGTNRLQDCDCLVVVGAPQPQTQQLIDMAAMLYHERNEPFDPTWSTRDRPYADQPWAWPIGGFWNDSDLQTLLEQFRESELMQAIHRARPLIQDVDVWLLTNVPIGELPVELISLHALFDAPAGVEPYRWPEVVQLAQQRMHAADIVTSADLVGAGLCKPAAARRYLDALSSCYGWSIVTAPATGRGKPPVACVKSKHVLNIDHSPISNL